MHGIIVVVFDSELKAYEGRRTLLEMDDKREIRVHADAVLLKGADGNTTVKTQDAWPHTTLIGTAIGSLIGMRGGPVGVLMGATAGIAAGGIADLQKVGIEQDFVDQVKAKLSPNHAAVVAEVDESQSTKVDIAMQAIGGTVFRNSLRRVLETVGHEHLSAVKRKVTEPATHHHKNPAR
jgi:uncharacterized membrane protein